MMKSIKLYIFVFIGILLSACNISQIAEPTLVNPTTTFDSQSRLTKMTPTILPLRMVRNLDLNLPKDCVLWSDITLEDTGRTMCVWGNIRSTGYDQGVLQINFGSSKGDFFVLTDDPNPPHTIDADCVMITEEIQKIDESPVIVWKRPNVLYFWDCN